VAGGSSPVPSEPAVLAAETLGPGLGGGERSPGFPARTEPGGKTASGSMQPRSPGEGRCLALGIACARPGSGRAGP